MKKIFLMTTLVSCILIITSCYTQSTLHPNEKPLVHKLDMFYVEYYPSDGFKPDKQILPNRLSMNTTRQLSKNHTFYVSAASRLFKAKVKKDDIDSLLEYCIKYEHNPVFRFKNLEFFIEKRKFKDIDAIYSFTKTYDRHRDLYMIIEAYTFFNPYDPKSFIQVTWSERGEPHQINDKKLEQQGRLFFERFKLVDPQGAEK